MLFAKRSIVLGMTDNGPRADLVQRYGANPSKYQHYSSINRARVGGKTDMLARNDLLSARIGMSGGTSLNAIGAVSNTCHEQA